MWSLNKRLALRYEELGSIAIIDRLLESANESGVDPEARGTRQVRRAEILAEIARLKAEQSWFQAHASHFGLALLLCAATACATLYLFAR